MKPTDADERGIDVKKEAENVLLARRIKWSVLKDSEIAVIVNSEKNRFQLGRQLSSLVSWTRILRVCKTSFHITKMALLYIPK